MKKIIALVLALSILALALCSCGSVSKPSETSKREPIEVPPVEQSEKTARGDLLADYVAQVVSGKETDKKFISAMLDFSAELMKNTACEKKENSLISPLSIILALAMTSNGAENETKAQFEDIFGVTTDEVNEYLLYYVKSLQSGDKAKIEIANSLWFSKDFKADVKEDFLQTNKNYYDPQIYEENFFDPATVGKINGWVKEHTDGMIEKVIEEINPNTVLALINALVFDAEWSKQYEDYQCRTEDFHSYGGETEQAKMMHGSEGIYLSGKDFTGFEKLYFGGAYKFVAVLPDKGVDVFDFVKSLDGDKISKILASRKSCEVLTAMPEFEYDYDIDLIEPLRNMGLEDAFVPCAADFSGIGGEQGDLYIGQAIHKTHIELTQAGTRAAAVTYIGIYPTSAGPDLSKTKTVILDRPFVYMIVDTANGLPLFMGTVTEIGK